MRRTLLFVLSMAVWMLIAVFLISCVFLQVGLDHDLYFRLQMRENVAGIAGLRESDLKFLDERLSACLNGDRRWNENPETRQPLSVELFGTEQTAFNEREITHMKDCQMLFALLKDVNKASVRFACLLMLVLAPIKCLRRNKINVSVMGAVWTGSAIILLPIAIFGIWAAIDFNSAFHFFHRILFTNDLWLLNPATDLLIRICPASMFASMGLRIGLMSAGVLIGLPLIVTIAHYLSVRKRKTI